MCASALIHRYKEVSDDNITTPAYTRDRAYMLNLAFVPPLPEYPAGRGGIYEKRRVEIRASDHESVAEGRMVFILRAA